MGLPSININFKSTASTFFSRGQKGVVALIVRDPAELPPVVLTSELDIPKTLTQPNRDYIARAFWGYVNPPKKVIVFIISADDQLTEAFAYYATQEFDYLCAPPEVTAVESAEIVAWIKAQRGNKRTCKAVLPNIKANYEAVVNVTAKDVRCGDSVLSSAEMCSRIAGLICGTPLTISCASAPLTEVHDVYRLTDAQADAAIDSGEFLLVHDGQKVKVGRGVNSLTTILDGRSDIFKKIKIVDTVDLVQSDLRRLVQDNYIGKMPNSYDNKLLLLTAVKEYFVGLERELILAPSNSDVQIDIDANAEYLRHTGHKPEDMSQQQIKEANTGDAVYLLANIKILDAIEDVTLNISI